MHDYSADTCSIKYEMHLRQCMQTDHKVTKHSILTAVYAFFA